MARKATCLSRAAPTYNRAGAISLSPAAMMRCEPIAAWPSGCDIAVPGRPFERSIPGGRHPLQTGARIAALPRSIVIGETLRFQWKQRRMPPAGCDGEINGRRNCS
jgi:hypothetical protein